MKLHWQEWFLIAAVVFFVVAHSLWAQEPAPPKPTKEFISQTPQERARLIELSKAIEALYKDQEILRLNICLRNQVKVEECGYFDDQGRLLKLVPQPKPPTVTKEP